MIRRKLKAESHEIGKVGGCSAIGGILVLKKTVDDIVIVKR